MECGGELGYMQGTWIMQSRCNCKTLKIHRGPVLIMEFVVTKVLAVVAAAAVGVAG